MLLGATIAAVLVLGLSVMCAIQTALSAAYFISERKSSLTDVLNGAAPGRTDNVQRILVYNYGIAIHDLVFAADIYDRATVPDTPYRYSREKYFI